MIQNLATDNSTKTKEDIKKNGKKAIPYLAVALKSKNMGTRLGAYDILNEMADPTAIPYLINMLETLTK